MRTNIDKQCWPDKLDGKEIGGERGSSRSSKTCAAPALPCAMGFITLFSGSNPYLLKV